MRFGLSDVFPVTLNLRSFVVVVVFVLFISSSVTKHHLPTMRAPYALLDLNEPSHTGLGGSQEAPIWVSDDEGATTDDDVEQEVEGKDQLDATTDHRPSTPGIEKPSRAVVRCPPAQSEKMKNGQFIVRWRPGGGWSAEWEAAPSSRSTCSSRRSTLKRKWTKWRSPTATPRPELKNKKKKKKGMKPASKAGRKRSPRRHSSTAAADAAATAQSLPASPSPAPAGLLGGTEVRLRKWDAMCARLKEWVESTGHLPRKREAREIFNWLHYNRRKQAWPRRTPTQVAKLLALGVAPYGQAIVPLPELDI